MHKFNVANDSIKVATYINTICLLYTLTSTSILNPKLNLNLNFKKQHHEKALKITGLTIAALIVIILAAALIYPGGF